MSLNKYWISDRIIMLNVIAPTAYPASFFYEPDSGPYYSCTYEEPKTIYADYSTPGKILYFAITGTLLLLSTPFSLCSLFLSLPIILIHDAIVAAKRGLTEIIHRATPKEPNSFWTPNSLLFGGLPSILTYCFLFPVSNPNHGSIVESQIARSLPTILKVPFYLIASAILVVSIGISIPLIALSLPIALCHDAIVALGNIISSAFSDQRNTVSVAF